MRSIASRTTSIASLLLIAVVAAVVLVAVPAVDARPGARPKTGLYKGTTSQNHAFDFRVVKATCAPPVRGGNQHQKKGYCFEPVTQEVDITETCPSGFVLDDVYVPVEFLLPAHGAITIRGNTRSDGENDTLHLDVGTNGKATGTLVETTPHTTDAGPVEQCSSGLVRLTAMHR